MATGTYTSFPIQWESINLANLGISNDVKTALLQIAQKVAYIDDQGATYYQALYDALYPTIPYTITNTLTGCTSSNAAAVIADGDPYTATITASSGYSLTGATVSITMGGTDITASAYNAGTISIASVTGDLSITVTAVAVTLSSISAVYTQSGTVYMHDSLDSLKTDLVVTATYSDSSSATVPSTDYTLSGTLTTGTSTITVTYETKTTTFTVTVTAGVPSGYTVYDYAEVLNYGGTAVSSDNWICTKTYSDLNAIGVEFEYISNVSSTGDAILGGRTGSGSTNSFAFYSSTEKMGFHIHGNDTGVTIPQTLNTKHKVRYVPANSSPSTIYFDGTSYSIPWSNSNVINTYITLFNNHSGTSNSAIKKDIKLSDIIVTDMSGDIINHYFPVVRTADNVIGIYDSVEGNFYTCSTVNNATIGKTNCKYTVGNWT